jgi:hypothetical protein
MLEALEQLLRIRHRRIGRADLLAGQLVDEYTVLHHQHPTGQRR